MMFIEIHSPIYCTIIGQTNKYVNITFQAADKIMCTFLDQQGQSTVSCDVAYGPCQRQPTAISRGTLAAESNTVNIEINPDTSEYCYVVNATNGTFTVLIEGLVVTSDGEFVNNVIRISPAALVQ